MRVPVCCRVAWVAIVAMGGSICIQPMYTLDLIIFAFSLWQGKLRSLFFFCFICIVYSTIPSHHFSR